ACSRRPLPASPTRRSSDLAAELFVRAASRFPDRPALWVDGRTWSYRSLLARARRLAARLREVEGTVCATLGERSLTAYCAPLARSEEHTSELQSRFDLVCR